jgi:uridine kinase
MPPSFDLSGLASEVRSRRSSTSPGQALLVGLSGIDGSGKGFLAGELRRELERTDLRVALVNVDGWLNLPAIRFSQHDPAGHFYGHALRLEEMFSDLVLPLRERRTRRLIAQCAEETATAYRDHLYECRDIDVVLVEGIFIYKRAHRPCFDLAVWIDCSFETALERALCRSQEGLPRAETIAAYETIYFPAQRLHWWRDEPRRLADGVMVNDPRLSASREALRRGIGSAGDRTSW